MAAQNCVSVFFSWCLFYHLHNKQLGVEPCSPDLFKPRWIFKNTLLGDPHPQLLDQNFWGKSGKGKNLCVYVCVYIYMYIYILKKILITYLFSYTGSSLQHTDL